MIDQSLDGHLWIAPESKGGSLGTAQCGSGERQNWQRPSGHKVEGAQ